MSAPVVAPDERAVREHLRGGRFLSGFAAGNWRLISLTWPFAQIAISAAKRDSGPPEFVLRFELSGYPHTTPTGGLWDIEAECSLAAERRPSGERVALLFRGDGMYAPWDRFGLQAHSEWASNFPYDAWNSKRDLSFVLSKVHEMVNADDYLGT